MRLQRYFYLFVIGLFTAMLVNIPATAQTSCPPPAGANPIQVENCLTGTMDWQIPVGEDPTSSKNPSYYHQVEGYGNKNSVNAGEQIRFHLNTKSTQTINIQIYRLGYYNTLGGRLVHTTHAASVVPKSLPIPNDTTGRAECDWLSPATAFWDVPANAVSGFYVAKLTGAITGHQSYIGFVVRRDDLNSDILFQTALTTHQAYNYYPGRVDPDSDLTAPNGKSLYSYPLSLGPELPGDTRRQAREVSFNRPFQPIGSFGPYDSAGLSFFNFEYPLIRWLEKKGYYVTYATDIDTHSDPSILANGKHKALFSNGHDEYWSWQMRDNVEQARNRPNNATSKPLNIGFFGGNICYWQIRLKESSPSGTQPASASNRTMVAYKETARNGIGAGTSAARDPYTIDGNPANDYEITDLWRRNTIKPPEDELVGVMTIPPPIQAGDPDIYCCGSNKLVFTSSAPGWLLAGTTGQQLPNLIGYESDEFYQYYPNRTTTIVASSPFYAPRGNPAIRTLIGTAETTFYKMNTNGAKVFAASGQQWSWGLDDWGADLDLGPLIDGRLPSRRDDAETITTNIVNCLINQNPACDL
jgi:hypothetical protein